MNWLGEMPLGMAYSNPSSALGERTAAVEDRVVHDLVQQDREVEDRESLHERQRDPDQRVLEMDESPGGAGENRELPHGDDAVPPAGLAVELAHNVAGQGFAKLSSERNRVLRVVM